MRILMVDDHVMVLQGLKNLLGVMVAGLQIDTANAIAPGFNETAMTKATAERLGMTIEQMRGMRPSRSP